MRKVTKTRFVEEQREKDEASLTLAPVERLMHTCIVLEQMRRPDATIDTSE